MLTSERWQYILDQLDRVGSVATADLVDHLQVSESTIRRDLAELEKQNRLLRVHGGAQSITDHRFEPAFSQKTELNREAKKSIAQYATGLVEDGDSLFIDAGTTTYELGPQLVGKSRLKIITTGLKQAGLFGDLGLDVTIIGGAIKSGTQAVVGAQAQRQLQDYYFDKAFIGINGIHPQRGLTTPDIQEALTKQTAIKNSRQAFILADHSKFDQVHFAKVADLQEATIITNRIDSDAYDQYHAITNIKEVNRQ